MTDRNHVSRTRVECYSGYRGEESPRAFYLADRRVEVETITERWNTPEERGFRVKGSDGAVYTLRQSIQTDRWEVSPSS